MSQLVTSNKRARDKNNVLHDVIDGLIYKEAINKVPANKLCVSLHVNTDGAPITSSTNYSLWPMLATIIELEPLSRESFKNMIFLGFWLGNNKPNYQLYTEKCTMKLKDNKHTNFSINS